MLIGLVLLALGPCVGARAAEERVVDLPLPFSVEGPTVKTAACFRIREKRYGADRAPWDNFKIQARTSPETDLTETIAAMRNKDISRLRELSHSRLGRDPEKYEKQASGFFALFERLKLGDVWGYYRFGDLIVFFLEVKLGKGVNFSTFQFAREETGKFGFLPYGRKSLTVQLLGPWFRSAWGPANSQSPAYCTPSMLKHMTHRVVLTYPGHSTESGTELLFTGKLLTDGGANGEPYTALRDTISTLANALKSGRMDAYFDGFTDRGRKKVSDWHLNADENERRKYVEHVESFLGQDPFFVINADPVFVVYTRFHSRRTASSAVHVLNFLRDKSGRFRWTNASYATLINSIFKSRRFKEAAGEKTPFDSWKIKNR